MAQCQRKSSNLIRCEKLAWVQRLASWLTHVTLNSFPKIATNRILHLSGFEILLTRTPVATLELTKSKIKLAWKSFSLLLPSRSFKDTTTICKKRLKSRFSIIGDYLSTWVRCIYKFSLVDRPSFQVSFFGESDYDSCSWRHQIQFLMDWSKTCYMANLENGYVLLTLKFKSDI